MSSGDPFLVVTGWNNTSSLVKLFPQPSWVPGQYTAVNNALSGAVALIGRTYELVEAPGVDQSNYYHLFAQLGLNIDIGPYNAKITVGVPKETVTGYTYYNAMSKYNADAKRKFGLFWTGSLYIANLIPL